MGSPKRPSRSLILMFTGFLWLSEVKLTHLRKKTRWISMPGHDFTAKTKSSNSFVFRGPTTFQYWNILDHFIFCLPSKFWMSFGLGGLQNLLDKQNRKWSRMFQYWKFVGPLKKRFFFKLIIAWVPTNRMLTFWYRWKALNLYFLQSCLVFSCDQNNRGSLPCFCWRNRA